MAKFNSNRTFGIEIEIISPLDGPELASALLGHGIDIHYAGYTHRVTTGWKIVTDASLSNGGRGGYGLEIVSPILRGFDGLTAVENILAALRAVGCWTNRSCGVHVHWHTGGDYRPKDYAKLIYLYRVFEPIIDSGLAPSRRLNAQWCGSLERCDQAFIDQALSGRFGQRGYQRYHKINLLNVAHTGCVEFRQHQGSLNTWKLTNWIVLTGSIVETARKMRSPSIRNHSKWNDLRRMILQVNRREDETSVEASRTEEAVEGFRRRIAFFAAGGREAA